MPENMNAPRLLKRTWVRSLIVILLVSVMIAWINGTHSYSEQVYGRYYHLGWRIFTPVFLLLTGLVFLMQQIINGFEKRIPNIILAASWILLIAWFLQLVWRHNGPEI